MGCCQSIDRSTIQRISPEQSIDCIDCIPGGAGIIKEPKIFVLREKMFSMRGRNSTYKVRDRTGAAVFEIKGNIQSVRDRITIKDIATNRCLCVLVKNMFDFTDTFSIWLFAPVYKDQPSEMDHYGTPLFNYGLLQQHTFSFSTALSYMLVRANGKMQTVSTIESATMFSLAAGGRHGDATATSKVGRHQKLQAHSCYNKASSTKLFLSLASNEYAVHVNSGTCPVSMLLMMIVVDCLRTEKNQRDTEK